MSELGDQAMNLAEVRGEGRNRDDLIGCLLPRRRKALGPARLVLTPRRAWDVALYCSDCRTRIQSPDAGGVKLCEPVLGNVSIVV